MAPLTAAGDHLRAAFIVAHVALITAAAMPTPGGYLDRRWETDPQVVTSVDRWASVPRALGVEVDTPALIDRLFAAARKVVKVRNKALSPFEPYFTYTGTRQAWTMFGGIPVKTGRLEVHVQRNGAWEPLFVEHTDARWRASIFEQERVRALRSHFAQRQSRGAYDFFADWVAARAREDVPDAEQVRVRYMGLVLADPADVIARRGLPETGTFWTVTWRDGQRVK